MRDKISQTENLLTVSALSLLVVGVLFSSALFIESWIEPCGEIGEMQLRVENFVPQTVRNDNLISLTERLIRLVDSKDVAGVGISLWIGLPASLLTGFVNQLAMVNAGEWLVGILLIGLVLAVWRR